MKKAFTLIELLVVIAIIAILAAILFPVFAQAKAAAKKTASMSNIKQLGTAIIMYEGDVDDIYPIGMGVNWWAPRDGGWTVDTVPYIKSYALLLDPSDTKDKSTWDGWMKTASDVLPISYAANGAMAWDNNVAGFKCYGVMGLHQDGWGAGIFTKSASASSVVRPAETIVLAARFRGNNVYGMGPIILGLDIFDYTWAGGAAGLTPDGAAVDRAGRTRTGGSYKSQDTLVEFNQNDHVGGVSVVYQNKTPFIYGDSHAKCVDPVSTNPDSGTQPSKNQWDAYRAEN